MASDDFLSMRAPQSVETLLPHYTNVRCRAVEAPDPHYGVPTQQQDIAMRFPVSNRLLLLIGAFAAPPAFAGEGPYLGFEARANFVTEQSLRQAGADAGKLTFDPGYQAGLLVGGTFKIGLRPELELTYRSNTVKDFIDLGGTSSPSQARVDSYGALVNIWYEIRQRDGAFSFVHPYLGGGVGGTRLQFRDPDFAGPVIHDDGRTLLAYQFGTGIGFDATEFVTISLDYRYFETGRGAFRLEPDEARFSTKYRANSVGASVRFSFAGSEYHTVVAHERPVVAPPPRVYGPPMDSDGDGVPDELDKCPGTPPGFKVDLKGCIVQQSVVLQAVEFDTGSDHLTPDSRVTLDNIAAALRGQPALKVEVGGYTDSQGNALANQRLSERRAHAVLVYLLSQGVSRANLTARGYGQARPIADNTTVDGRAQNRRVEFKVLMTPPTVKVIEKKPR
jgi:OOP family OmpA-OmpF porin